MDIGLGQILAWLLVGALVGMLVGRLVKNRRRGFGWTQNLVLGTVGAIVGGFIFNLLDITIGGDITVSGTDFIAAFVGAFIVLFVIWIIQGRR